MPSAVAGQKMCATEQAFPRRFHFWRCRLKKWPFEQFREALEDPGMDGTKPEARWQVLNTSLDEIKRAIRRDDR
jgi:hypothetical protein